MGTETNQSCLDRPHAGAGQEGRGKVGLLTCKRTMGLPEGPSFSFNSHLLTNFLSHSSEQSLYHGALTCGWQSDVWERERKGKEKEIDRQRQRVCRAREESPGASREAWSCEVPGWGKVHTGRPAFLCLFPVVPAEKAESWARALLGAQQTRTKQHL